MINTCTKFEFNPSTSWGSYARHRHNLLHGARSTTDIKPWHKHTTGELKTNPMPEKISSCLPDGVFSKEIKLDYIFVITVFLVKFDVFNTKRTAAHGICRFSLLLFIASSKGELKGQGDTSRSNEKCQRFQMCEYHKVRMVHQTVNVTHQGQNGVSKGQDHMSKWCNKRFETISKAQIS